MKTTSAAPSLQRRITYFAVFGIAVAAVVVISALLLVGDIFGRLGSGARHEASAAAAGVTVRTFVSIDEDKVFPYGLAAAPDGTLYVSLFGKGTIQKISTDGKLSTFNMLTAPGAMAAGPDGSLYVIDFSAATWSSYGTLKRITPDGKITLFGGDQVNDRRIPLFAQLAVDPAGNVYLSQTGTAQIWRITPDGVAQFWWALPSSSNVKAQPIGMVYDAAHRAMIVADAGTASLYRVDATTDRPSGVLLFHQVESDTIKNNLLGSMTTLAVDGQGRLLIATWKNDVGILSRLEPDGITFTQLATNFRAPMGLVYRDNKVYVVNSDLPGLIDQIKTTRPYTIDVVELPAQ